MTVTVREVDDGVSSAPVFTAKDLEKTFKVGGFFGSREVPAVQGVDLKIGSREVLGLVGESGSGKSTVARLIAKLYEPTGGTMTLTGDTIPTNLRGRDLLAYRKRVQMIFQDPVFIAEYRLSRLLHPGGVRSSFTVWQRAKTPVKRSRRC